MKTWLVACSKGGVGKTTIATHLAAEAAVAGHNVVLLDADPQGSATRWCQRRSGMASAVLPVDGSRKSWPKHIPDGTDLMIVDAPAGAMGNALSGFLDVADALIVPIQPSALDIEASVGFLESLAKHPRVRNGKLPVGLVGNRLKPHTNASQEAMEVLRSWPFPLVAELRDSQAYVVLTGLGKSLFDYHSTHVREHQADWQPLLQWLHKG